MTVEITQSQERENFLGEAGRSGIFIYHPPDYRFYSRLVQEPAGFHGLQSVSSEAVPKLQFLEQPLL
jgi:hypothetical protein